jgi:hypothetical protein
MGQGLLRRTAPALIQPPVVVQVKVEPRPENTAEPPDRADPGRGREVRGDLLDRPPRTQRRGGPLVVAQPGEVVDQGGTLGVRSGPDLLFGLHAQEDCNRAGKSSPQRNSTSPHRNA